MAEPPPALRYTGKEQEEMVSMCHAAPVVQKPAPLCPRYYCLHCGEECKTKMRLVRNEAP